MPACPGSRGTGLTSTAGPRLRNPSEIGWQRTPPRPRIAACAPGASIRSIQAQGWAGRPARSRTSFPARFEREVLPQQGRQVGAPENHVAPGQERVEGPGSQLRGHRFEGLDRDEGDGGVHVRGLAEEPVADDALAGHQFHPVRVRRGDLRCTVAGAAEVGVRRRDEEMEDLDVVPVACRHALKLSSIAQPRHHATAHGPPCRQPAPSSA